MPADPPPLEPLLVACLCAAWCGTCRDYQPVFERLAAGFDGQARFVWVDIEDHAEVPGDIDVENFPTLLVARGDAIGFYGPVLPHPQTAQRLVESGLRGELAGVADDELAGLPARVRALAEAGPAR